VFLESSRLFVDWKKPGCADFFEPSHGSRRQKAWVFAACSAA
jgi:hypothetical protein